MKRLAPLLLALFLLLLLGRLAARAQSVGIGTATPDASAALDVAGTARGLLVPRLTQVQRAAIAAPAKGLLVFQTDGAQPGFWFNAGPPATPAWTFLSPTGTGDNLGNHTATQDLNLGANALVGAGASLGAAVGLGARADGGLNIGQNTAGNNVYLGYQAGAATTTGSSNQFSGFRSGQANTTGQQNQFSGHRSGLSNTTGNSNLFSGYYSGFRNTTGSNNQFIGYLSGLSNTTGDNQLFIGFLAGASNTTGLNNQFIGYLSGQYNTTGNANHFSGYQSGRNNTTGVDNQFIGYESGYSNTTGSSNQFCGSLSGYSNTIGFDNQFSGYQSGFSNTTGFYNQFSGNSSGRSNTTGDSNQFSGLQSGYQNTTGSNNTFSGYESGRNNTTGSGNWCFGYLADVATGNLTNAGSIGYQARVAQSNSLVLGGTGPDAVRVGIGFTAPSFTLDVNGSLRCVGAVNTTSDQRLKQDIRPIGGALAAVLALRGVRYTFRRAEFHDLQLPAGEQVGLLAQELERVYPELVSTDREGYKAVNYAQLTPVLIEALKEQQVQLEALKAANAVLRTETTILKDRTAAADADHASLLTLQAQMARLLGEAAPAGAQARK